MQKIKTALLRTVAVMAFTGLTIAGWTVSSSANSGSHDYERQDSINSNTGSGTGGSVDTGTTDSGSGYRNDQSQEPADSSGGYRNDQNQESTGSSSGSGSGGSTDVGIPGIRSGTGPHYGTAPLGGPSGNDLGNPRHNISR
jgi:hypothetical protein